MSLGSTPPILLSSMFLNMCFHVTAMTHSKSTCLGTGNPCSTQDGNHKIPECDFYCEVGSLLLVPCHINDSDGKVPYFTLNGIVIKDSFINNTGTGTFILSYPNISLKMSEARVQCCLNESDVPVCLNTEIHVDYLYEPVISGTYHKNKHLIYIEWRINVSHQINYAIAYTVYIVIGHERTRLNCYPTIINESNMDKHSHSCAHKLNNASSLERIDVEVDGESMIGRVQKKQLFNLRSISKLEPVDHLQVHLSGHTITVTWNHTETSEIQAELYYGHGSSDSSVVIITQNKGTDGHHIFNDPDLLPCTVYNVFVRVKDQQSEVWSDWKNKSIKTDPETTTAFKQVSKDSPDKSIINTHSLFPAQYKPTVFFTSEMITIIGFLSAIGFVFLVIGIKVVLKKQINCCQLYVNKVLHIPITLPDIKEEREDDEHQMTGSSSGYLRQGEDSSVQNWNVLSIEDNGAADDSFCSNDNPQFKSCEIIRPQEQSDSFNSVGFTKDFNCLENMENGPTWPADLFSSLSSFKEITVYGEMPLKQQMTERTILGQKMALGDPMECTSMLPVLDKDMDLGMEIVTERDNKQSGPSEWDNRWSGPSKDLDQSFSDNGNCYASGKSPACNFDDFQPVSNGPAAYVGQSSYVAVPLYPWLLSTMGEGLPKDSPTDYITKAAVNDHCKESDRGCVSRKQVDSDSRATGDSHPSLSTYKYVKAGESVGCESPRQQERTITNGKHAGCKYTCVQDKTDKDSGACTWSSLSSDIGDCESVTKVENQEKTGLYPKVAVVHSYPKFQNLNHGSSQQLSGSLNSILSSFSCPTDDLGDFENVPGNYANLFTPATCHNEFMANNSVFNHTSPEKIITTQERTLHPDFHAKNTNKHLNLFSPKTVSKQGSSFTDSCHEYASGKPVEFFPVPNASAMPVGQLSGTSVN